MEDHDALGAGLEQRRRRIGARRVVHHGAVKRAWMKIAPTRRTTRRVSEARPSRRPRSRRAVERRRRATDRDRHRRQRCFDERSSRSFETSRGDADSEPRSRSGVDRRPSSPACRASRAHRSGWSRDLELSSSMPRRRGMAIESSRTKRARAQQPAGRDAVAAAADLAGMSVAIGAVGWCETRMPPPSAPWPARRRAVRCPVGASARLARSSAAAMCCGSCVVPGRRCTRLWARATPRQASAAARPADDRAANPDAGRRVAGARTIGQRARRAGRTAPSPRYSAFLIALPFEEHAMTGATMNAAIDFAAVKTRQQTAWASGDYAVIGTTLQLVGERSPKPATCAGTSACSTSPPATATRRSRPRAAAAG